MNANALISIIMPCFNVACTLARALDSVLMQRTDFPYEILIIDDCSTDYTIELVQEYANKYEQIRLIRHRENLGNAWSFYDGLCAAQGDFFCVLDGDDYYTHREKLQRQIDFFRTDVLGDYVAAVHHYIYDLCDGSINISPRVQITEFTYADFLMQNAGYYHTSTYMFRNIFKGNVPEYFKEKEFRGDTPRTAFHLQVSRKKVKILDFVGSAYVYTYNGIWSGMTQSKQKDYQIRMLENLKRMTNTPFEAETYEKRIQFTEKNWNLSGDFRSFISIRIDYYLEQLKKYIGMLAFAQRDYIFENLYYSQYVDSVCATLSYVNSIYHPECVQQSVTTDRLAIVIGILNPRGGGIFREIVELIEIYEANEIMVLVTNMTDVEVPEYARELLGIYPNVSIKAVPSAYPEKLVWLSRTMAEFAPVKAYYYTSHNDPYAQALMQSGICKNVCLFSFDHGFICGISNPNLDCVIAKRPLDYKMLRKRLGAKVIYIPTWGPKIIDCEGLQYMPFNDHKNLITASSTARFYKFNDRPPNSYLDNVLELLCRTKGKHYHLGPIPQDKLDYINTFLEDHDLPREAFVHIEWSDNVLKDLLQFHADIFIEPFPIVSYRLTLEMLSSGIPVIAQENIRRMSKLDFIYPGNLLWKTRQDFLETLSSLTQQQLFEHSQRSLEYFHSTHAIDVIRPYLLREESFPVIQTEEAVDGELLEIRPYEKIFGEHGKLNLNVISKMEQVKAALLKSFDNKKPDNFCFLLSQNNVDNKPYIEAFTDLGYSHQTNRWQDPQLLWLYNSEYINENYLCVTDKNIDLMEYITAIDQMTHIRQSYDAVFFKIEGNDPKIYFKLSESIKYDNTKAHKILVEFFTSYAGRLQLFYMDNANTDFNEENSALLQYGTGHKKLILELPSQAKLEFLRLDIDNYNVPIGSENRVVLFKFVIFEDCGRGISNEDRIDIWFNNIT